MSWFKSKRYVEEPDVVYELRPGSTYLIEYAADAVTKEQLHGVTKALARDNIHVVFVLNRSNHVAFTPVPATRDK